ncbi:unnamed protein product [Closterium sp. NIES-64]|nr:unnamed protein product [Closterium sp. NIES-64]
MLCLFPVSVPTLSTPTLSTPTLSVPTLSVPTLSVPTLSVPTLAVPAPALIILAAVSRKKFPASPPLSLRCTSTPIFLSSLVSATLLPNAVHFSSLLHLSLICTSQSPYPSTPLSPSLHLNPASTFVPTIRKSYRIHARLSLLNSFAADFICVQSSSSSLIVFLLVSYRS